MIGRSNLRDALQFDGFADPSAKLSADTRSALIKDESYQRDRMELVARQEFAKLWFSTLVLV